MSSIPLFPYFSDRGYERSMTGQWDFVPYNITGRASDGQIHFQTSSFQTVIHFEESFLFPGSLFVSGLWSWRYGGNYPLLCKVFGGGEVFRSYSGVIDMNPIPKCELFIQSGEALVNLPFWLGGRDDEWRRYSVSAINKCREVG